MIIDPTSPCALHIVLLDNMDEESTKRLRADAERIYGSPWAMKLRDFFACMERDFACIGVSKENYASMTVRQYVWLKDYYECEEQVANLLKAWQIPQSSEAQKASAKCLKMTPKEGAIVFTRRYFGLTNFDAAMEVPLSDFIVAKKDEFNGAIFQYSMNEIQKQKLKTKR